MANTPFFFSSLSGSLPVLDLNFTTNVLDPRITFSRSTTATYIDASGNFQLAAINAPRFDHDLQTGARLGLLKERARVARLLRSTFAGAIAGTPGTFPTGWTTVFANGSIASVTADTLGGNLVGFSATANRHYMSQTLTVANGATYASSVYVHSNTGGVLFQDIMTLTALPGGSTVTFLANGTTVNPATYVPIAGDRLWIRLLAGAAGNVVTNLGIGTTASTTGTVVISKPQNELGFAPSSYIPTLGATVNRGVDIASITGVNFTPWFSAAAGTLYGEARTLEPSQVQQNQICLLYDNPANLDNSIVLHYSSANAISLKEIAGVAAGTTDAWPYYTYAKFAIAYENANSGTSFNGATVKTIAGGVPPGMVSLGIGGGETGLMGWEGHIKRIAFWRQRLINAELQARTKI